MDAACDVSANDWELIDCFSGGSVFSYGARASGMHITHAVDFCPEALDVYKQNFPEAKVSCATLGSEVAEHIFPEPRPKLHVHLSPPCQELSNAKSGKRCEARDGLKMLRWSVHIGAGYASFSIETVHTSSTLALAKEVSTADSEHIAYGIYNGVNFSAPQSRVRLVISTPSIIRQLNEAPASARTSVENAFCAEGIQLPIGATHIKNSTSVSSRANIRPIQAASFTCCASRALSLCNADGEIVTTSSIQKSTPTFIVYSWFGPTSETPTVHTLAVDRLHDCEAAHRVSSVPASLGRRLVRSIRRSLRLSKSTKFTFVGNSLTSS